jgi:hypothetical protein
MNNKVINGSIDGRPQVILRPLPGKILPSPNEQQQ